MQQMSVRLSGCVCRKKRKKTPQRHQQNMTYLNAQHRHEIHIHKGQISHKSTVIGWKFERCNHSWDGQINLQVRDNDFNGQQRIFDGVDISAM